MRATPAARRVAVVVPWLLAVLAAATFGFTTSPAIAGPEEAPPSQAAQRRPRLIRSMEAIYVIDRGKRRWVVSPQVFTDYRFREEWVEDIPDDDLNRIGLGPDLVAGPVLRGPDGRTWIVYQGTRHLVVADDAYPPMHLRPEDGVVADETVISEYPVGRPFGNVPAAWPGAMYAAVCLSIALPILLPRNLFLGRVEAFGIKVRARTMFFIFVALASLILRLYYILLYPWIIDGADASAYVGAARHLIGGGSIFSEDRFQSFIGMTSPFYSIILYATSPVLFLTNGSVVGWKVIQALLALAIAYQTYHLGRLAFGRIVGSLSGIVSLSTPAYYYVSESFGYEIWLTFFLVTAARFTLEMTRGGHGHGASIAAAGMWGLAIFAQVKVAILFLGSLVVARATSNPGRLRDRRHGPVALTALVVVVAFVPTLLWGVRNVITHDRFLVGSAAAGGTLWVGIHPEATGGITSAPRPQAFHDLAATYPDLPPAFRDDVVFRELAVREMLGNPARFLRLGLVKLERLWWAITPDTIAGFTELRTRAFAGGLKDSELIRLGSKFINYVEIIAISWMTHAIATGAARRKREPIFLLFLLLLFSAIHMVVIAEPRYRVPVLPLVHCIAAWFIVECYRIGRSFFILFKPFGVNARMT